MIAIRAMADDYDRWAANGCPGWSYHNLLPYLRRMESDLTFGDRPYHGAEGPIPVLRLGRDEWGPADNALADSALGLGYRWCEDHDAPTGTGVSPYGISARDGARVTTNDGYLVRMRDGVKRALELLRTGSFDTAFERIAIDLTGRGIDVLADDTAIDRWLMQTVGDTGHICCTCRMGARDDPSAVVDPQGRVLGVEGLWVADASVFPEVPRANTNLPTIAAAERMSELIRNAAAPPEWAKTEAATPAGS